jgi:general stress protein YciG
MYMPRLGGFRAGRTVVFGWRFFTMTTKKRGFASMDAARQREIASKGGRAAHEKGTAHEFTPEEAREAGRKGGQAAHSRGTAHRFTSEEAREAGRKGGRKPRI